MAAEQEWSPGVGWRKAIVRILIGGAVLAAADFGACALVFHICNGAGMVPFALWAGAGALAGLIGGFATAPKIVDSTGLCGAPLLFVVSAGMALMLCGAWALACLLLAAKWGFIFIEVSMAAGIAAAAIAAWCILLES